MELHPIIDRDTRPNTGMWYVMSALGECPSVRVGHTASHIPDQDGGNGKVYVIGGANPSGPFSDIHVLDLETFSWDIIDVPGFSARYEHAAFVPKSQPKKIYIFGGADQAGNHNDLQVFDTVAQSWSTVAVRGTPPSSRTFHTSSSCVGDKFIVYSGGSIGAEPVSERQVHCFDTNNNSWSVLNIRGDSPKPRHGHVVVAVGNRVFVHGGMSGTTFYSDLHMLDLEKNTWTNIKQKKVCPPPRAAHGAFVVGNHMNVFGGMNKDGALDDLYRLDTESLKWNKVDLQGPPPGNRLDFAVCEIKLNVPKSSEASAPQDVMASGHRAKEIIDSHMRMGSASSRGSSAGSRDERMGSGSSRDRLSSAGSIHGSLNSGSVLDRIPGGATGMHEQHGGNAACNEHSANDNGEQESLTKDQHTNSETESGCHTEHEAASAVTMDRVDMMMVLGGMDTEGEIFEDCLIILPS